MSTEQEFRSDRMARLRDELVATVNATPYAKPRLDLRVVMAAIAAFALAGAVTGGAISAAALASTPDAPLTIDVETMAENIVGTHAQFFGTPVILSGRGESVIDLGVRPEGATSIAIALNCVDPGSYSTAINGVVESTLTCTADDAESNRKHSAGAGSQYNASGNGRQTLTIDSDGSRYVVWASWAAEAAVPNASAAQTAELADGQVTRDEYVAAFDRFAACMSEAGQPVIGGNKSGTVIDYSITDASVIAGIDTQCYAAEFQKVDETWQVANEDSSEGTEMLRACLVAAGLTPAPTTAELVEQLQTAGLFDSCH